MPRNRNDANARLHREERPGPPPESPGEIREEAAIAEPTPEPTEVVDYDDHYATHLRETTSAIFICSNLKPVFKEIEGSACRLYRDRLIADCGSPKDPIEVMFIEQMALANFSMGLMQARAASERELEAIAVFSSVASRLMAEFRRSALALQAYRAASRHLANDPTKDIVMPVEGPEQLEDSRNKKLNGDEVSSTRVATDAGETIIPYPGPASLGDQPAQSSEVARAQPRRPRKGARHDAGEPAVGEVNRAANS
jgi:hypothetical protein